MHSKLLHLSAGLVLSAAFCTPALADQSKPKGYSTDQPKIILTTGEDLDEWTFIINADEEEMGKNMHFQSQKREEILAHLEAVRAV